MITVQLTNGFGNNIFQFVAAKLLSIFHDQNLLVLPPFPDYYAIPSLERIGIKVDRFQRPSSGLEIGDSNYKFAFDSKYSNSDFILNGYFEDHTYYKDKISLIKSWFNPVQKRSDDDLVIHFRTGDRLFMKNEFHTKPRVVNYFRALEKFDFDKLYIVTDMPFWRHISIQDLQSAEFHINVPMEKRVDAQLSVDYFNEFIDGLSKFEPIVENRTIDEDFNFIRTFDNILFEHGTLAWWAAVLSEASQVGVYGPWRPWKKETNKNLSKIDLKGWFQWE